MVDLVKIRKKAKKAAETAAAEPAPPQPAETSELAELESTPAVASQSHEDVPHSEDPTPAPRDVAPPADVAPASARPSGPSKLDKFLELAGTKRDVTMVAQSTEQAVVLELLTFVIAAEHYAVDIEHIVEIVTPRTVTRVPNAQAGIVGIVSLRGTIVTLIDARRRLRHREGENTLDTRIIVVEQHGETVGFEVDRVLRVVKISPSEVSPHPVVHISEQEDAIRGVFLHANALTILLDLDKLLDGRSVLTPA